MKKEVQEKTVFDHVTLIKDKGQICACQENFPVPVDYNCQKIILIGLILWEIFN